jgi:hypothetical protein
VCDELTFLELVQQISTDSISLKLKDKMHKVLKAPEGMDPELRKHYLIEGQFLSNILLSPRGAFEGGINICKTCMQSLNSKSDKPPQLAIANGLCIGELPNEFKDLRQVEMALCSMVRLIKGIIWLKKIFFFSTLLFVVLN